MISSKSLLAYFGVIALSVALCTAWLGVSPASAGTTTAPTLAVANLTASPEQELNDELMISGSAPTNGSTLYADARPAADGACLPTYAADQAAFPSDDTDDDSDVILGPGDAPESAGAFNQNALLNSDFPGSVIICAWIDDSSGNVAATASTNIEVRQPQVTGLVVSTQSSPQPNVSYAIRYAVDTDQDLTLYSFVIPASQGPCAATYEAQGTATPDGNDVFGDSAPDLPGGEASAVGQDTEAAGSYLVCTWVEGPDGAEVDALMSTPVTVGSGSGAGSGGTASGGGTGSGGGSGTVAGSPGGTKSATGTKKAARRRARVTLFVRNVTRKGSNKPVFAVRPRSLDLTDSTGGRLVLKWRRWSRDVAIAVGVGHPGGGRPEQVRVDASHRTGGMFTCLSVHAGGATHYLKLRKKRDRKYSWRPVLRSRCTAPK